MKPVTFVFCILFLYFPAFGQRLLFKGNNALLPQNLILTYVVDFHECVNLEYLENPVKTDSFLSFHPAVPNLGDMIVDNMMGGKTAGYFVDATNPFFPYSILNNRTRLTQSKVAKQLGEDTVILLDGEEERKMIRMIKPEEIAAFEFVEEWELNSSNFIFTKKVVAFNPLRVLQDEYNYNQQVKRGTFYIIDTAFISNKPEEKTKLTLVANIQYEFYIDKGLVEKLNFKYADKSNPFEYIASGWNGVSHNSIIDIFSAIANHNIRPAYDFTTKQKLTYEEVRKRLGMINDTIRVDYMMDGSERQAIVQREFEPERIKSVIFIEDWYIDPETLHFEKQVKGIAPVLYPLDTDKQKLPKRVPFVVYFNSGLNR
jgi:hypothetical protein